MRYRPSPGSWMAGGLHTIGHNFEISICEVPLARDRFPATAFHPATVVAAVFSGKRCGGVRRGERRGAWHKRPTTSLSIRGQPTLEVRVTVTETYLASCSANFRSSIVTF